MLLREWKGEPQTVSKFLQSTHLINDLHPVFRKNSQNSTIRKRATQLKNGPKMLTDTLPKKILKWQICT